MADTYLKSLLGENEDIKLVTHRHWFVLLEQILVEIILSILVIIVVTVLLLAGTTGTIGALGYLIIIIPLVSLLRDALIWSNHKYVITNYRVVQVMGVFNKNVIDSSLEKVNDIKMKQSFFGRMFNFGDIEILTASELGVNRFTRIGNPVRFKTAMLNAKTQLEERVVITQAQKPADDVATLLAKLGELRDKGIITPDEFQAKKEKLLSQI